MKKISAFFVILALLFAVNSNIFSQPKFTINLTGGYSLPLPDLKGDIPEPNATSDPDSNTYKMKSGFNFGLTGKYAIGKKGNLRVVGNVGYVIFNNSKEGFKSGTDTTTAREFKLNLNAFTAGLGVEWAFMPKGKANPFFGVDFTGHFYSGKVKLDPAPTDTFYKELSLTSESRFGVAIGGGVDIAFSKSIGAVIGIKYNLHNLIGKKSDVDTNGIPTGLAADEFALLDKEYTAGTRTIEAKSITDLQLYAGVSFYLGQPKKKVKK